LVPRGTRIACPRANGGTVKWPSKLFIVVGVVGVIVGVWWLAHGALSRTPTETPLLPEIYDGESRDSPVLSKPPDLNISEYSQQPSVTRESAASEGATTAHTAQSIQPDKHEARLRSILEQGIAELEKERSPERAHLLLLATSAVLIERAGLGTYSEASAHEKRKIPSDESGELMFVLQNRVYECVRGALPELDRFQEMMQQPGDPSARTLPIEWYDELIVKSHHALRLIDEGRGR